MTGADNRDILLSVRNLAVHFPLPSGVRHKRRLLRAVDGISFDIRRGQTFGLVGESGCGKSTTARSILQLHSPTRGEAVLEGIVLNKLPASQLRLARRRTQMIFQDPYGSLNPRMSVGEIVREPMQVHRLGTRDEQRVRVAELLSKVGLESQHAKRYPHEFSGGQLQRIGIARALAAAPQFVVCDEPISALDVSIRAQILNLLHDLQSEFGLTYLFIAHDLSAVRHIADSVAVMYLGKLMELADSTTLYASPQHPYTKALLSAIPLPDPRAERQRHRIVLDGDVPSAADPPSGCVFRTRCPIAADICALEVPEWRKLPKGGRDHWVACHLVDETEK